MQSRDVAVLRPYNEHMHISEEKSFLRQAIKKRIDEMSETARHAEGRTLSRVILQKIPKGSTVCAYFPLKSEADIRSLLQKLIARGDTVYLPVYEAEEKRMIFKKVSSLGNLAPGAFTIPEPPENAEVLHDQDVQIVLVPGRAFDRSGRRLGRGSGGYDQWIEGYKHDHPKTQFWGTCLQCQVVAEVPAEQHDMRMDAVITAMEISGKLDGESLQ